MVFKNYPGLRFCKIKKGTKAPYERDWVNKGYTWEEIQGHITREQNFGVICGYGGLIVIDSDTIELRDAISKVLPKTFRVKTGSGGTHDYYICKELKKKIVLQTDKHFGEVQCYGTQVVAPGSIHPTGNKYEIVQNIPMVEIDLPTLTSAIKPFMQEINKEENKSIEQLKDYGDSDINSISIMKIMNTSGYKKAFNKNEYFGVNPWHGSSTGMNTWVNPSKNVAHCFRCNAGINVATAIGLNEGIISNCYDKLSKDDFLRVLEIAQSKYGLKKIETNAGKIFTDRTEQAKEYEQQQPIFYDKTGMFWLWNSIAKRWEAVDEVDILNIIEKETGKDIIESKNRTEIINALKQEGRKKIPKSIKPTWIQFDDTIVDIITGEQFKATPEYFVTNPIPYKLHSEKFMNTPVMDKIFEQWVGKEYVNTLYEIIAYSLLPDYPIHRLFCLIGGGMNGKSKFIELTKRFIGLKNVTSTELDTLLTSRFEVTRLYKKLLCVMGETNFSQLEKTSILKKLTGGDYIGFEYKNKTPFEDYNYAKIIIATNNLPETTDKTLGFYRRWLIIDFPNQFSEEKDILAEIPSEEYECLAIKCVNILKDLLESRKFTNEGGIDERAKKFEDKSNPLDKFLNSFIDISNPDSYITSSDFYKKLNQWLIENRYRSMSEETIGKKMRDKGYEKGKKYASWLFDGKGGQMLVYYGIQWK